MRNREKKAAELQGEPTSYWKSTADVLLTLILVILLFLMIMMLSVLNLEESSPKLPVAGMEDGASMGIPLELPDIGKETPPEKLSESGRSGGGSEGGGDSRDNLPREPVTEEGDDARRASVYVVVEDEETEHPIQKAGITFELYDRNHEQQVLHVYYPKLTEYSNFRTTETGTFYLPEKIAFNEYYLKNLTAPEGYDPAKNVSMTVNSGYEWTGPYVVRVPMSPSKNFIRIQVTDKDSRLRQIKKEEAGKEKSEKESEKESIQGGVSGIWNVVAEEDIVTADGTLRYRKGDVAATIRCGSDGYGESGEIYLGEYRLLQKEVPYGYVEQAEPVKVRVEKKAEAGPAVIPLITEKTEVTVQLKDEDNEELALAGAEYELTGNDGDRRRLRTDAAGMIVISELNKNTTYSLRQISGVDAYRVEGSEYAFHVDEKGLIEEAPKYQLQTRNRIIRVSVKVEDRILRKNLKGCACVLTDGNGKVIREWNTDVPSVQLDGMNPGTHTVSVSGAFETKKMITVRDKGGIQQFTVGIMTPQNRMLLGAGVLLLLAGAGLLIFRKKGERRESGSHSH